MTLISKPSPNHNRRPPGTVVDCIVLHADADASVAASLGYMLQRSSKVSYHYLIGRLGDVYQLVRDEERAWHAGVSAFMGRADVNTFSIGVSFGNLNDGKEPFPGDQIEAGVELCAGLVRKFPRITADRITTHALIALPPGRRTDPGPLFPFDAFVAAVMARAQTRRLTPNP